MRIPIGNGIYGRLPQADGSEIGTLLAHVGFLPFFPVGSLRLRTTPSGQLEASRIELHLPSLLAGFGWTWGVVAGLVLTGYGVFLCIDTMMRMEKVLVALIVGNALFATAVATFWSFGSRSHRLRRMVPYVSAVLFMVTVAGGYQGARNRARYAAQSDEVPEVRDVPVDAEDERRVAEYQQRYETLYALYQAMHDRISDDRFSAEAACDTTGTQATNVWIVPLEYLAVILDSGDRWQRESAEKNYGWITSQEIKEELPIGADQLVGVTTMNTSKPQAGGSEARYLYGYMTVFQASDAVAVCDVSWSVDLESSTELEPLPQAIQQRFRAAARAAVEAKSDVLEVF